MLLDYKTIASCSPPEQNLYLRILRRIPSCEISPAALHNPKLPDTCKAKGARRSQYTLQNTPDACSVFCRSHNSSAWWVAENQRTHSFITLLETILWLEFRIEPFVLFGLTNKYKSTKIGKSL